MKLLCHWVCATDCRDLHAVDTGFSRETPLHTHTHAPHLRPQFSFFFIPLVGKNKSSRLPSSDGCCQNWHLVVILKMSPIMANSYSLFSLIIFYIIHIYWLSWVLQWMFQLMNAVCKLRLNILKSRDLCVCFGTLYHLVLFLYRSFTQIVTCFFFTLTLTIFSDFSYFW